MSNPEKLSTIDAEYRQNRSDLNEVLIILKMVLDHGSGDAIQKQEN